MDGNLVIEWLDEHVWENRREASGFFHLPGAENISAVLVNLHGTLPKFNRLGYLAEFGDRRVRMAREGLARIKGKPGPSFRKSATQITKKTGWRACSCFVTRMPGSNCRST
jgi:hypothetical protein